MSKHTPGPWVAQRHGAIVGGPEFEFTNGKARKQIAMACAVPEGVEGDQQANALLIAAAPELLEALLYANAALELEGYSSDRPYRSKILAAIAKAEGMQS